MQEQNPASCSLLIGRLLQLTVHLHSDMACQFLQASVTTEEMSEVFEREEAFNSVSKTEEPQEPGAVWPSGGVSFNAGLSVWGPARQQ